MSHPYSDSETYITKSTTWKIKRQSSWCYTSPIFYINKQECSIEINIANNGYQNQYTISTINLNFTEDCCQPRFIVILYFENKSTSEQTFILLPAESTSNKSFKCLSSSRTFTETSLGHANCRVTAVIFYRSSEDCKITSFLNDMKCMLKSEIHSDFKIKAGDKVFNVHKAVIAARSNVLKKMIENNMLEKKSGQIELQADPIVVQALLDYLYTSKCKVTVAPTELFKLAHFLELEELEIYCKKYLLNNIHLKNIISILELTSYNDYNLGDLHDVAMKFVNKNEDSLTADIEFEQFLCDNIKLETITYILRLSYKHQLDDCLNKAMEFIRTNYEKVLNDSEFEEYLKSEPTLSINILRYCLYIFNTASVKKV